MVKARARYRQFDVFPNPDKRSSDEHPFLIVLQSNGLSELDTCIVAPPMKPRTIKFFERLMPEVTVNGAKYTIAVPDLGVIPPDLISSPVANLESERYRIIGAIDLVFTGV